MLVGPELMVLGPNGAAPAARSFLLRRVRWLAIRVRDDSIAPVVGAWTDRARPLHTAAVSRRRTAAFAGPSKVQLSCRPSTGLR